MTEKKDTPPSLDPPVDGNVTKKVLENPQKLPFIDNVNEGDPNEETTLRLDPKVKYFAVGPREKVIVCPFCNVKNKTKIRYCQKIPDCESCWCCPCIIFLRFFHCFCLPCNKSRRHFCRACNAYLGVYNRPYALE